MQQHRTGAAGSEALWLAAILVVAFALRLAAIKAFEHVPQSDELAYQSMAISLVKGDGIVDYMGNRAMYNVGYPLFVLAPAFFLAGESLFAARFVNLLLGLIAVLGCYFVAREAGAGRVGRLAAAALWAVYLPASVYGVYLAKEHLMIPLMLGVLWCILRLSREPSPRVATTCGGLFGLLALTGNAALCLFGPLALALVSSRAAWGRQAAALFAAAAVTIVVAAPWALRNLQVLGAPVLNTNGGFNLYLGNNPAATGMFVSIAETPRGPTWEALRGGGEVAASAVLRREAIEWITGHPAEFADLALRKAMYFWTPPLHTGQGEASLAESLVRVAWAIQFIAMVVAALATLAIRKLHTRPVALLWLSVLAYTAVHMLFYVIFRYREPIMPVIAVLAAMALEAMLGRFKTETLSARAS